MNIEIANRLVQLRKKNNLSQEELALKIGISRQAVSKWERAEASPDTDNLISLSKIYNVSLDDLLKSEDEVYEYVIEDNVSNGSKPVEYQYESKEMPIEVVSEDRSNGYRVVEEEPKYCQRTRGADGADGESAFYRSRLPFSRKQLLVFPYPVFVTLVFLVLGSVFDIWHPAWLLYLTIPLYYPVVSCVSEDGTLSINRKTLLLFPYPVFVTIVYLLIGFAFGLWHPGWILYLTVPMYYTMVKSVGR
jgi:transcriptional regulator with XRE-family HTH domain